jgi:hypothetical protein
MFNLNINWLKIVKEQLKVEYHTPDFLTLLTAAISPFIAIHNEFMAKFKALIYKIAYTFQVNSLRKRLNDRFSPVSGGILIEDGFTVTKVYIYKASELKPPRYIYRKWKPNVNYVPDNYAVEGNKVYKCLVVNDHKQPSTHPTEWVYHNDVFFLRRSGEYNITYNFIVKVPISVVFDIVEMKAIIDYYRFAGKRYKIITY